MNILEAAKALPLEKRIELAEALWDSITGEGFVPPLSSEQAAELDRRVAEHRRNPEAAIPWETIKHDLEKRFPMKG
jgi:putative addiction module component (TIGR02574 family)